MDERIGLDGSPDEVRYESPYGAYKFISISDWYHGLGRNNCQLKSKSLKFQAGIEADWHVFTCKYQMKMKIWINQLLQCWANCKSELISFSGWKIWWFCWCLLWIYDTAIVGILLTDNMDANAKSERAWIRNTIHYNALHMSFWVASM